VAYPPTCKKEHAEKDNIKMDIGKMIYEKGDGRCSVTMGIVVSGVWTQEFL
jgi:hypothetical protein